MFLPQRSLQTVTFLGILVLATCQDIENRRAVTELQLLHDRGRTFQGLKRLVWLQRALGTVHTARARHIPLPNASWDVRKHPDPSDLHGGIAGDENSSGMRR
ncbi:PTH4 protein, partial [Smithornis capensis]|nr:PTH4 protein [Smithornis capensis]